MGILANVISLGLYVPLVGLYISIFSELRDPVDSEELNALTPLRRNRRIGRSRTHYTWPAARSIMKHTLP
jgi:hypothetical protein